MRGRVSSCTDSFLSSAGAAVLLRHGPVRSALLVCLFADLLLVRQHAAAAAWVTTR